MDPVKIYGGLGSALLCFSLAVFALWQRRKALNLHTAVITPDDYSVFSGLDRTKWYIQREEQKLANLFTQRPDRNGKSLIYEHNETCIGTIDRFNKYICTIKSNGRTVVTKPDIQDFTNFLKKIEYIDQQNNLTILELKPDGGNLFNIHYQFSIDGKNYSLKSNSGARCAADFSVNSEFAGRIALVSAAQYTMAVTVKNIDPLALTIIYDLFSRYAR